MSTLYDSCYSCKLVCPSLQPNSFVCKTLRVGCTMMVPNMVVNPVGSEDIQTQMFFPTGSNAGQLNLELEKFGSSQNLRFSGERRLTSWTNLSNAFDTWFQSNNIRLVHISTLEKQFSRWVSLFSYLTKPRSLERALDPKS